MSEIKSSPIFFTLILGLAVFYLADRTALGQVNNEKAPSFTLNLLKGGEVKSSDLEGKVTVLKFVASY